MNLSFGWLPTLTLSPRHHEKGWPVKERLFRAALSRSNRLTPFKAGAEGRYTEFNSYAAINGRSSTVLVSMTR